MNETIDKTPNAEKLAKLVNASFPALRCLRCGNEQFYVTDDPAASSVKEARRLLGLPDEAAGSLGPVVTLACRRCGHVEQHLTDLLQKAQKPIVKD